MSDDDIFERCIAIATEVRDGFLSEEYAFPQPIGSMCERFTCDQVIEAIRAEQQREAAMTELARLGQEFDAADRADLNHWLDKIETDARLGDTMIGDLTLTDRTGG